MRVVKSLERDGWHMIHDSTIECSEGCTRERPDVLIDLGDRILIVEVDENQHASYPLECELTRMGRIAQTLGGPPVVFIRWNPDGFSMNGVKQKVPWAQRYDVLVSWMRFARTCHLPVNSHNYIATYLFYDDTTVHPPRPDERFPTCE